MPALKSFIVTPLVGLYRLVWAIFSIGYWLLVERNSQITRLAFQLEKLNKEDNQLDNELDELRRDFQLKSNKIRQRKKSIDTKRSDIVRQLTNVGNNHHNLSKTPTTTPIINKIDGDDRKYCSKSSKPLEKSLDENVSSIPSTRKVADLVQSFTKESENCKFSSKPAQVSTSSSSSTSSSFLSASKNFLFPSTKKSSNETNEKSLKTKPPSNSAQLAPSIKAIRNQFETLDSTPASPTSSTNASSRNLFGGGFNNNRLTTKSSTAPVCSAPPLVNIGNQTSPTPVPSVPTPVIVTPNRMNDYFELILQNTIQDFRQSNPSKQFRLTITELYGDPEWRPLINDLKRQYKIFCYL